MLAHARRLMLALGAAGLLLGAAHVRAPEPRAMAPLPLPPVELEPAPDPGEQCSVRTFQLPTGAPPHVSCGDARRVTAQVRARLAEPAARTDVGAFADLLGGWLDPHGLWSAAPDAPARASIALEAQAVLREIELDPADRAECGAALRIGRVTRSWVEELRQLYTGAAAQAPELGHRAAFRVIGGDVFEDDPVTRPARALARDLGRRSGVLTRAFGGRITDRTVALAEARLLPTLSDEQWSEVVLAAALRAYVPTLDVHGQWAPLDEELSLYSADSAAPTKHRLWDHMTRSVAGARLIGSAAAPLRDGDIVLGVDGVITAGLSVEQAEQLSVLEPAGNETARTVTVLRAGRPAPEELSVPVPSDAGAAEPGATTALATTRLRYGAGEVLVVTIEDVPDWLGEALADLVTELNRDGPPLGIVLDLRGNGGGSTDGAAGALGVFIPDVPSFPLKRRDGGIEVERTFRPARGAEWSGPLAVLVDGYTASAAEMIAGAIESYRRGPVIGSRTFGKGCIQEYFDDRAATGVLRLTTMVFALPDGSPVQGTGIKPDILLPLPAPREREATLPGSFGAWTGPDVRDRRTIGGPAWPSHEGRLGRCRDPVVCRALRQLGRPSDAPYGPTAARRASERQARLPGAPARARIQ